jgi:hypothetical protein
MLVKGFDQLLWGLRRSLKLFPALPDWVLGRTIATRASASAEAFVVNPVEKDDREALFGILESSIETAGTKPADLSAAAHIVAFHREYSSLMPTEWCGRDISERLELLRHDRPPSAPDCASVSISINRRHSAALSLETSRRRPATSVFGARPRFIKL